LLVFLVYGLEPLKTIMERLPQIVFGPENAAMRTELSLFPIGLINPEIGKNGLSKRGFSW